MEFECAARGDLEQFDLQVLAASDACPAVHDEGAIVNAHVTKARVIVVRGADVWRRQNARIAKGEVRVIGQFRRYGE